MSDKKVIDDKIGKELEDRLDDDHHDILDEDDYTVKVHREDYTVKRRFFDKGKALEAADSLRMDKRNIVEDNIEHDFVTLIDEEDDVDWDKLVDSGLKFHPPISDAAEKKLEDTSNVAEELAAERAMVGSELDKTLTMGSRGKIKYPKIEKKKDVETAEDTETADEEISAEIEVDMPGDDEEIFFQYPRQNLSSESVDLKDSSVKDELEIDEDEVFEDELEIDEDEVFEDELKIDEDDVFEPVTGRHAKSGFSFMKICGGVVFIILSCAALFFYFSGTPDQVDKKQPVTVNKTTTRVKIVKVAKPPVDGAVEEGSQGDAGSEQPENILTVDEPEQVEDMGPEPVEVEVVIPEVTKFHPYTLHISSYKSQAKADSEVSRISKKGYNAYSAYINIPGKGGWHRIYAGYYDDYKKATKEAGLLKMKLREDATVAKTIYAIQVGEIALKEDFSELKTRLRTKGYSVYYIPVTDDGEYFRLLAGAYRKEAGAKGLYTGLSEDGFDVKIVKR